ncbi:MAG TPA: hypothetical protein VJS43_16040 [Candidatus Acidoferrales bacterium]|nr:hypothetical protein [Candidatus Acidoferrales bacterium]
MTRISKVFVWIAAFCGAAVLAAGAWIAWRTWPRKLSHVKRPGPAAIFFRNGQPAIASPTNILMADVGDYDSTLQSYLYFDFLRSQPSVDARQTYLCRGPIPADPEHTVVFLRVDADMLRSASYLGSLVAAGLIPEHSLHSWLDADLAACRGETEKFVKEFNAPPPPLSDIPDKQLIDPVANFILFKATTDRRLLSHADPAPIVPSPAQARQLAEDMIVVARFYSLPLDYFLGIGAMENNYMSVRGDLDHAVWKRRAQRGDIVVRRRRGRVLVRNYSRGVWQITRETLRYAQLLYLRDRSTRDYSVLPEALRPSTFQDPDEVEPETLATYAGLLLRNLLDRFHGDIMQAVGAYNGGSQNPNPDYARSVHAIGQYARRMVGDAATMAPPPGNVPADSTTVPHFPAGEHAIASG